ncbi:DUF349 domain-containing protein [Agromyces bauzanensis]|uniref:DUF349 domain-containing protein n=1 Tax=Agromyces bauzanensis TaxID=1308924 RepID=A0A917PF98_9MICO|nr:hypothetical protein GCM10011372_10330 [Agromyces bauzanensis]
MTSGAARERCNRLDAVIAAAGGIRPRQGEAVTDSEQQPWGRVDETGTVFVRTADGEREVGQYPDATPEEALAYFERKYADLAGQVGLLEQRVRRGAPAADVAKAVASLRESVAAAKAVGDLESLARRLEALSGTTKELTEQQQAEAKAAIGEAIAQRTRIVERAESLAAQDPAKTQWKQATAELDALFASWQQHQQEGPRLPKNEANELWKRFRTARSTIEQHRKAFFAELDAAHRDVRARKQRLIERAEALAPRGADAVADYRSLLDEWKQAGRAGKKVDDALWARFKAAGDVLFQAKAEVDAKEDEEYRANLTEKLALLEEAEKLLAETDPKAARAALNRIQRRWDDIGRVPRDQVRPVEDRLRKVETHVRSLEDQQWEREDPEKKARSEGMLGQLQDAIAKLESELAAAETAGDRRAADAAREALDARRAWLKAVGG